MGFGKPALDGQCQLVSRGLSEPEPRGEEIEKHQENGEGGGASEVVEGITLEDVPVVEEAQGAPDCQQEIGLRIQAAAQQEIGQEGAEEEEQGEDHAPDAHLHAALVPIFPGFQIVAEGHVAVGQGTADGDDVHQPDNGGASQQGNGERHGDGQEQGIPGHAVEVGLGELQGQQAVFGHELQQVGAGAVEPQDAGGDGGEHSHPQHPDASHAVGAADAVEDRQGAHALHVAHVVYVVLPGGVLRGDAEDGHAYEQGVGQHAAHHRYDYQGE